MTVEVPAVSRPRQGLVRRSVAAVASGFGLALGRFPVAILVIAGLGLLANLEVAGSTLLDGVETQRLTIALLAAACFSVSATLLAEARGISAAASILAGALAAVLAGALVWTVRAPGLYAPSLLAAAVLSIFLAPCSAAGSNSLRFWTFVFWTLLGCLLGFASVLLFVAGGSAIVEMVRYLFGIGPQPEIYRHVFATAFVFVGPVFALGRIPRDFADEARESGAGRLMIGLKVLADWIAAPLTLAAGALLHAYAAKFVLTGDIPLNRLGWITATFIIIVLGQRILVEPFRTSGGPATVLFRRLWAVGLVVPVLLFAYALRLRIGSEGWTEERYFAALLCLTAAIPVVLQIAPKLRGDIRHLVAVPAVLLALASFGPWGASQTVGRSQSALIRAEFADEAGRIRTAELDLGQENRLRSRIRALWQVGALSALTPFLPENTAVAAADDRRSLDAVLRLLGVDYARPPTARQGFAASSAAAFDVSGFDTVYGAISTGADAAAPASASVQADGASLRLTVGQIADVVPLGDLATVLMASGASDGREAAPVVRDVRTAVGRMIRLRILSAVIEAGAIRQLVFDAALRREEWSR